MQFIHRLACCSVLMLAAGGVRAQEPFKPGGFKAACMMAGQSRRIVLVDFYTTWCGPCKMLDETTWKNKEVRAWLDKTAVCRKIDAEKDTALAARYKIRAYPTILLLRPDGTEIDRLVGFREPKVFLSEAKQALGGVDSIARARQKSAAAGKDNPQARMEYADALAAKSRYADALKEYLWCLDEGDKHDMSFMGVRLSFLLNSIVQLGHQYPPALAALTTRRDTAREALLHGTGDFNAALDLGAYNRILGQDAQTVKVYDTLKAKNSPLAAVLFEQAFPSLLAAKRYADIVAGAGDISARVDQQMQMFTMMSGQPNINKEVLAIIKKQGVDKGSDYYEALTGTGDTAQADKVRDKLLTFDPNADTYTALIRHALRAGKPDVVQHLLDAARATQTPEAYKQIEQAAK